MLALQWFPETSAHLQWLPGTRESPVAVRGPAGGELMFQGTTRRVTPRSQQTSFTVDPLAQLLVDVAAILPPPADVMTEASKQEHARLRSELAAVVAAAPVREVVRHERVGRGRYALHLQCGHRASYFKIRADLPCHECVGQASPTCRPHPET